MINMKLLDADGNEIAVVRDITNPDYHFNNGLKDAYGATSWVSESIGRTDDQKLAEIRSRRDRLLAESDFTQGVDYQSTLTDEQKTAWADYRQALRDLPASITNIKRPNWPVKPV